MGVRNVEGQVLREKEVVSVRSESSVGADRNVEKVQVEL